MPDLYFLVKKKDINVRKFKHAEKCIRGTKYDKDYELKASFITNSEKGKLYRSLNNVHKFCVVVELSRVHDKTFDNKKSKQRFSDYVYKIAIKRFLTYAIDNNLIKRNNVTAIHFFVDEHTTATNGRYELRESLEQELKVGTFNYNYSHFFPPVFDDNVLKTITLDFCNSASVPLIRAADIVANRVYHNARTSPESAISDNNLHGIILP